MKCYREATAAAEHNGWRTCGYHTCNRAYHALPPALVCRRRHGKKRFEDDHELYIERDYSTLASNDIWSWDHHRFDVLVKHEGKLIRPWLTAAQDVRSRLIVSHRIFAHDPNADSNLLTLRQGVRAHGLPAKCQIDNGKDFDARALTGRTKRQRQRGEMPEELRGAFNILAIEVQHVWPYHGQSKPIERFFRTAKDDFSRSWPTFTGGSPSEKPEDLQHKIDRGQAPTLEDFAAAFAEWIEEYHQRPHQGNGMDGRSPAEVFTAHLAAKRVPANDDVLIYATSLRRTATVGQAGVRYRGLNYGSSNELLQELHGQRVQLAIDVEQLDSVLVADMQDRLICRAKANVRLPFNADSQSLRDAIAQKKKSRRVRLAYLNERPRMHYGPADVMWHQAAKRRRQAEQDSNPPAPLQPHRTDFDEQLPALRREVVPQRKAVGAEGLSTGELAPISFAQLMAAQMQEGSDEFDWSSPRGRCSLNPTSAWPSPCSSA